MTAGTLSFFDSQKAMLGIVIRPREQAHSSERAGRRH